MFIVDLFNIFYPAHDGGFSCGVVGKSCSNCGDEVGYSFAKVSSPFGGMKSDLI